MPAPRAQQPLSALGFAFLTGWVAHHLAISLSMMHGTQLVPSAIVDDSLQCPDCFMLFDMCCS